MHLSIARLPATKPKVFLASNSAIVGVLVWNVSSGAGATTPAWRRAMYPGSRFIPCVSTPRRSASIRAVAIMSARSAGTPWEVRIAFARAVAEVGVMFIVWGVGPSILIMVFGVFSLFGNRLWVKGKMGVRWVIVRL